LALWLPVLLGTGIALYFALDREPEAWIAPPARFSPDSDPPPVAIAFSSELNVARFFLPETLVRLLAHPGQVEFFTSVQLAQRQSAFL
jgi:hypothetical protein